MQLDCNDTRLTQRVLAPQTGQFVHRLHLLRRRVRAQLPGGGDLPPRSLRCHSQGVGLEPWLVRERAAPAGRGCGWAGRASTRA